MEMVKILDLDNDGLNMASDEHFLYIRCKRAFYKIDFINFCFVAQNEVFKKDGKSRNFAVCDKYIVATDFCDLLVIDKNNLHVVKTMRLGTDLSSDLGVVRCDNHNAYINIRNGKMAVMDLDTMSVKKYEIFNESSWEHCVVGNFIYTGTINGNLVETDKDSMQLQRKIKLCKKNIYSVVFHADILYTISQDMTIKAVDAKTLEVIRTANNAVKGMTRIIGIYQDFLVIANNGISLWDKQKLELLNRIDIPTGQYNKGALLRGNLIIGSDFHSIYFYSL